MDPLALEMDPLALEMDPLALEMELFAMGMDPQSATADAFASQNEIQSDPDSLYMAPANTTSKAAGKQPAQITGRGRGIEQANTTSKAARKKPVKNTERARDIEQAQRFTLERWKDLQAVFKGKMRIKGISVIGASHPPNFANGEVRVWTLHFPIKMIALGRRWLEDQDFLSWFKTEYPKTSGIANPFLESLFKSFEEFTGRYWGLVEKNISQVCEDELIWRKGVQTYEDVIRTAKDMCRNLHKRKVLGWGVISDELLMVEANE
ncbi:hypothetical protein NA57DRAFT_72426 [Rhizodiscina lignyota]|uniref:Uncharacterized protein n=1 Tax=Rhizodiscina lignyota TaxID=1504668 RepID=A0A9P4MAN5_9PEZI|nr:hypothetical protein NA57DRAFT_72426 [Rhizodiscina lignyota]